MNVLHHSPSFSHAIPKSTTIVPEGFGTAIPSNPTELLKFLKKQKQQQQKSSASSKKSHGNHDVDISMERVKKQERERELFESQRMESEDNISHRQDNVQRLKRMEENLQMETEDAVSAQLKVLFKEYDQQRLRDQILKDVERRKAEELAEREVRRKANEARRTAVLERIRKQQEEEDRRRREAEDAVRKIEEEKSRKEQYEKERLLHDRATMNMEDQFSALVEQEYREYLERKRWQEREKAKLLKWEIEQKKKDALEAELRAKRMAELEEKKKKLEALKKQQQAAAIANGAATSGPATDGTSEAASNTAAQQLKEQGDRLNKQMRIQNRAKFVSKKISAAQQQPAKLSQTITSESFVENVVNINSNQQLDQILDLSNLATTVVTTLDDVDANHSSHQLRTQGSSRNLHKTSTMKLTRTMTMKAFDDVIFHGTTNHNTSGQNIQDQSNHDLQLAASTTNTNNTIESQEQQAITKIIEAFKIQIALFTMDVEVTTLQKELMSQKRNLRLEQHGRPVRHGHHHNHHHAPAEVPTEDEEVELSMKAKVVIINEKMKLLEVRLANLVLEKQAKAMGTTTAALNETSEEVATLVTTEENVITSMSATTTTTMFESTVPLQSIKTLATTQTLATTAQDHQDELFKQIETIIRQTNKLLVNDFSDIDVDEEVNFKQLARDGTLLSMELSNAHKSLSKDYDPLGYHEKLTSLLKRLEHFVQQLSYEEEQFLKKKDEKLKEREELKRLEALKLQELTTMKAAVSSDTNIKISVPMPEKSVPSLPISSSVISAVPASLLPPVKSARASPRVIPSIDVTVNTSLPHSGRNKSVDLSTSEGKLPAIAAAKVPFVSSTSTPLFPAPVVHTIGVANVIKQSPRITPRLTPRASPRILPELQRKPSLPSAPMVTKMQSDKRLKVEDSTKKVDDEPSEESKSYEPIIVSTESKSIQPSEDIPTDDLEEKEIEEETAEEEKGEEEINPETLPGWEDCIYSSMFSAAHAAAFFGHMEVLQFLIKYFDCFIMDKKGRTPLFYASLANRLDCVALLLSIDPQWIDVGDEKGDTPLHAAAISNGVQVLAFLLSCEANPDTANYAGLTPSHLARTKDALIVLHESKAQLYCVDNQSRIPLYYACLEGRLDCVAFLCQQTPTEFLLWKETSEGDSCLHAACKQGHADVVDILAQSLPSIDDLAVTNTKKHTPAHVASTAAVLKTLYENGANLWLMDEKGRMPLFIASFFGRTDCVAFLVELGMRKPMLNHNSSVLTTGTKGSSMSMDSVGTTSATSPGMSSPSPGMTSPGTGNYEEGIRHTDKQGDSALHVACLCGHVACVNLLLYYLSNEDNKQHLKPSDLARRAKHERIATMVETIQSYKTQGYTAHQIFHCDFTTLYMTISSYGSRWVKQYDLHFQCAYYVERIQNSSQWDCPLDFDMLPADEQSYDQACKLLVSFYTQYNPEKLPGVNNVLWMYRGRYTELFISLANKYNLQDLSMFQGVHLD